MMRGDDLVARLGGDEFAVITAASSDHAALQEIAGRMIATLCAPYSVGGHTIVIGASIGIAVIDQRTGGSADIMRYADMALYRAKNEGRNRACVYDAVMDADLSQRKLVEQDLRETIEQDGLKVFYQPIFNAGGDKVVGVEALARWLHPTRGFVPPSDFIPLAEESGLIAEMGEWILREACREAASWPKPLQIAVNLSPAQFVRGDVVGLVHSILLETGLSPGRLELEITEGVFLAEGDSTDETFTALKALGVRLALDDFGTGYSSLGYLKKAPFDKIKIDQSFVRGAASSSSTNRNAAIIRAIVTLADTLGMDTCAEGVETHDDLHLIRDLGVSQVQGYIFGKPVPWDEAREIANSTRVEAEGFDRIREPRHRLMRRALAGFDGVRQEIRLRNISAMGALVESTQSVSPGQELTVDIVGVGPVLGTVRWAQAGKFGVQFTDSFDLTRLAPKAATPNGQPTTSPWHLGRNARQAG